MKRIVFFLILVEMLALGVLYSIRSNQQVPSSAFIEQRLAECDSLPSGSVETVAQTTRLFINLPKDLYPNKQLQTVSDGATAGYVSNGGPYGEAVDAQGKPNCWSYYFEFDGAGSIDLSSKGAQGVPDYRIRVIVSSSSASVAPARR